MSIEEQKTSTSKTLMEQEGLWKQIFLETKEALRENGSVKKEIIRNCCRLLEKKGMPLEMICGKVTRELAEFASRKYLFEVIDQKYKDSQKIRAYNHKQPGETMQEPLRQESVHLRESNEEKKEQEDSVIWQINVSDYRIEDVEKYDKIFLQKIVVYQHNRIQTLEKALDAAQQQKGV